MILCILIVAYLALRAGFDELPAEWNVPHLTVMLVGTLVNLLLVLIAFFSQPPGSGWSLDYGAFIGLFAAIIAAAPYAVPQLRVRTM
jgi:cadmium resistance protein CadD (predicted permease)